MKQFLLLFALLFLLESFDSYAQEKQLIQLSGVVVTEEAFELPYTTVYNKTLHKGLISDGYGFFSIVCNTGDTILFSRKGYTTSPFVVPDSLNENRVYPWPNKEAFAQHFVNMNPYEDDIRRAQRELSGESLAFVAARLDADPSLAFGTMTKQQNTKIYTNGQLPQNNLLNPYAWSKLIKDWQDGKLSRQ